LIIVVNVFCFGAATPFVLRAAVLQPMNREEALSSREEEEAQSWLDAWHERVVRPWFVKRQVEDATAGAQEEDQTEDVGDDGFVHVRRLTSRLAQSPPAAGLRAHQQALLS
jgi:predicted membrane-bound mannosyltransferase